MSAKKENSEASWEDPVVAPVPKIPAKLAKSYLSFDMYCTVKDVPYRRRAGMRAFTKLTRATFEEWESTFKSF